MKLLIQIEGVPVAVLGRTDIDTFTREQMRVTAERKPIVLSVETDDGEMILKSAEQFLCDGMASALDHVQYGNCVDAGVLMPSHRDAEERCMAAENKLDALHVKNVGTAKTEASRAERDLSYIHDLERALQHEKNQVAAHRAAARVAIECCGRLEEMVLGSTLKWPRGLRKSLLDIRASHAKNEAGDA